MSTIKEIKEKMQRTPDKDEMLHYSPIYKKKKEMICMTKNKIKDKFDKI